MSTTKSKVVNISEFKTHALRLIDKIARTGVEYVITRKGEPVARVIPIHANRKSHRGSLKGLFEIQGDIIHFDTSDEWEVLQK